MTRIITLLAAGTIGLAPAIAMAAPGGGNRGGGPGMHGPAMSAPTMTAPMTAPATPRSPTGNGGGYNHLNSPQHATGQPMQSCETTGSPPGHSANAQGSAFADSGTAGSKYAGEQPQNSRNTASVSQYDVACANQPH